MNTLPNLSTMCPEARERNLEMYRADPKRYNLPTRDPYVVAQEAFRKLFAIQHNPDLDETQRALRASRITADAKKPQLLETTPEQDFQNHLEAEARLMNALAKGRPDLYRKYLQAKGSELDRWDRKLNKPTAAEQKARALEAKLQKTEERLKSHEDLHEIQKQTAKEQLLKAEFERKTEELANEILEREKDKPLDDMNLPRRPGDK